MKQADKKLTISSMIVRLLVMINVVIVSTAYTAGHHWYWALLFTLPLLLLAIWNTRPPFIEVPKRRILHKHHRIGGKRFSEDFLLTRMSLKKTFSNYN